jgi:hypothetical protein
MSVNQLLETMAASLSEADVTAIRKARGLKASETASRSTFASFFVSSIGLETVIDSLSVEERATLRLLSQMGEVDIAFFERLYGSAAKSGEYFYGTYTQRYRQTFEAVKRSLVRRGLVVMAETKMRGETVQMERWRFALPPEFAAYIPPLLHTQISDQPGETSDWATRKKLVQAVSGELTGDRDRALIALRDGSLWLGKHLFSIEALRAWQMDAWMDAFNLPVETKGPAVLPAEAIRDLFADFAPDEWAAPGGLGGVLKIYCYGIKLPSVERLLSTGWELGLLSRLETGQKTYYRLAPAFPAEQGQPSGRSIPGLRCAGPAACTVDLKVIPLTELDLLNRLADLHTEGTQVLAAPSLVKMGRATPAERSAPLAQWLGEHLPAFREALAAVDARWGKTILHENLLVARVNDLSLRVQLERELGAELVVLDDHFVAFPRLGLTRVEKVLKKTGFVVKTVTP